MFYYPNVLQRHTGCFSTIWLAATKGIRITRREFLKVNIGKTCEDIIDYVKVQVPPLHPSLPRPRFSLYLSSQLQYGVVIVFHRQCAFLLEEVQQTIEHLLRSEKHSRIDMQEPDRLALNLPDSLFLLEEAEGALAPFFGKMGAECELSSPSQLPQPWQFMIASSPDRLLETSKKSTAPIGLTASPEAITIKDREPVTILTAEFGGAELPQATAQEIDLLMKQQDQFLLGEVEDKERERAAEGERSRELEVAMVSLEQLKDISAEDKSWIIEDTRQPLDVALQMVATEMTPPPATILATTEASERDLEQEKETEHCSSEIPMAEERIPPERRSRKRQLIFADQHTQISQEAMREQINNPLAETQLLSDVLIQVLPTFKIPSSYVFSSPCNLFLHHDLQSLWKQCCVSTTLPDPTKRHRPQEDSELSEIERERGEEKEGEWRKRDSSMEVLRESGEAGLLFSKISAASDVALDVSKGDRAQSDLITPTSRWSPQDEATVHMEAISEERVELPQGEAETREITPHSLLKMLNTYIDRFGKVSFHSLLPPETDRSIAAHLFYNILELACVQKLSVNQTGPYGPITICSGHL
ncbi:LOW QUALITY PROTEIN: REC8 meiotic recombination protein b [Colossoma macropomum]|uniref:LOW QUALITY PROTEIN: REC8 meiotic recombination protein b n=1 Tax=Colossoma macropomum TaxID=42526 RepID=UPI001863E025|nr:LOW QUALITY PROTEIN: REC8 meiotic recombination protein b [Colossoma macropomum]